MLTVQFAQHQRTKANERNPLLLGYMDEINDANEI